MQVITENGRRRAVENVEVKMEVDRPGVICTWCDGQVSPRGITRAGLDCCENPRPMLRDDAVRIELRVIVSLVPGLPHDDREVLDVVGFVDGEEFVLSPDERDAAAQEAREEW